VATVRWGCIVFEHYDGIGLSWRSISISVVIACRNCGANGSTDACANDSAFPITKFLTYCCANSSADASANSRFNLVIGKC
jgi:hypothetical protein